MSRPRQYVIDVPCTVRVTVDAHPDLDDAHDIADAKVRAALKAMRDVGQSITSFTLGEPDVVESRSIGEHDDSEAA